MKNAIKVVTAQPPRTFSEAVDDASISAQIKSDLLTRRSTGAFKTKVATQDGVVTLSVEAKNKAEKDLVTKLASDIHGLKTVKNNLEVKELQTTTADGNWAAVARLQPSVSQNRI